jgi:hypothetical protein
MSLPVCPMCESDALTVMGYYDIWQTACRCTKGRSRISATHSVRRWLANARKRNELRAVAIIAERSGQPHV